MLMLIIPSFFWSSLILSGVKCPNATHVLVLNDSLVGEIDFSANQELNCQRFVFDQWVHTRYSVGKCMCVCVEIMECLKIWKLPSDCIVEWSARSRVEEEYRANWLKDSAIGKTIQASIE